MSPTIHFTASVCTRLHWFPLWCFSSVVAAHECVRDLWGMLCMCVCTWKAWSTEEGPVRRLDVRFYCNRKHLGQMLPCSEVTCGFQTGQSFPISAWEAERERRGEGWGKTIKWGHNCFLPPLLHPVLTSPAPSPDPCIAFPVKTASRHSLFTLSSFPLIHPFSHIHGPVKLIKV